MSESVLTFRSEERLEYAMNNIVNLPDPLQYRIVAKGGFFTLINLNGDDFISPEAQAVLDRMTGLTAIERDAIIKLVNNEGETLGNGNYSHWDEFFALSLVTGNPANALTGFKAKTAVNNGAILDINGATFAGTEWIDSNYNPSVDGVNYQLDDVQVEAFVKAVDLLAPDGVIFGTADTRAFNQNSFTRIRSRVNNSDANFNSFVPLSNNTLTGIARNSASNQFHILNGVQDSTNSGASVQVPSANFGLGSEDIGAIPFTGTLSTFLAGGVLPHQEEHYQNIITFLSDLGTL